MPSRLSSLLVRDGLVGVKRMEQAFQRQVIYGGSLDTILLEMNLVPEDRLVQYLSLATGIPPADRGETEAVDADALRRCPREVATRFQVAPLAVDGDALRVLVKDPVDLALLEELADELAMPIQPLVAPEYRFSVVRDRLFGDAPPARFTALASKAPEAGAPPPVGKPRTVIIDAKLGERGHDDAPDHQVVDVALPPTTRRTTQTLSTEALARDLARQEDARRVAAVTGPRAVPHVPKAVSRTGEVSTPTLAPAATAVPEHIASIDTPLPVAPGATPQRRQWQRDMELDVAPLTPVEALDQLEDAPDRDTVFGVLLRAIRGRAWYAGLLTVQGGAAVGRVAIAGSRVDTESIGQVLIPLDVDSAFTKVVKSASPYIGPVATGDPDIDPMLRRMGGVIPPTALLIPIALRTRVVAIAIGHRGGDGLAVAEVSSLLPLAAAAAEALSRLIMRAKGAGYRAAGGGTAPRIAATDVPSKDLDTRSTGKWRRPTGAELRQPTLDFGTEVSAAADEPVAAGELLDIIESADEEVAAAAIAEAVQRPREIAELLAARFPGKLLVDRYELGGRVLRADQHGRLLDLVIRLGPASAYLLIEKMREGNRDERFYATLCASELRPRSALPQLVERLFDPDYGVRETAIRALIGYPPQQLDAALEVARRLVHADDGPRAQAAANALAELTDVGSIPDLLDVTSRGDATAGAARRALVTLTRQDFGTNTKKWRAWWADHKQRHRIEWLIDALSHKDEHLRRGAIEDLRRATGEDFAYHQDLPRRERDEAKQRWLTWWNGIGKRRFSRDADPERHRPTAVLPRWRHNE